MDNLTDTTKVALQYAKESSERVRKIVVLLSVASIVTFVAWWNQYENGWTMERLHTAQRGLRYLCDQERKAVTPGDWVKDACAPYDPTVQPLTKAQETEITETLKGWGFTRKQLERHIQDLQDQLVSGVLKINVPFFGVSSDINDLGILSGIAIVALIALLRYTIWREEQNVTELFKLGRTNNELRSVLSLFAMTQVFTIPPWTSAVRTRSMTRLIYWMPAPAYGLVAAYDTWQTYSKDMVYRAPMDWVTLVIEVVVLSVIISVRYQIGLIADRIDQQWSAAWNEFKKEAAPLEKVHPVDKGPQKPSGMEAPSAIVPAISGEVPVAAFASVATANSPTVVDQSGVVEDAVEGVLPPIAPDPQEIVSTTSGDTPGIVVPTPILTTGTALDGPGIPAPQQPV